MDVTDSSLTTGQPGIGVAGAPSGNTMRSAHLGPIDRIAPSPVDPQSLATTPLPYSVEMQWQEPSDGPSGIGVRHYLIYRNGQLMDDISRPEYVDETTQPSTTYNYQIVARDMHLNDASPTSFSVTTPPYDAYYQRRVGVKPNIAYWGGGGEQVDTYSGNLNFTLPLLEARGRGSWGVTFSLSYNSQQWRKDPAGTWKLGRDVGYGYGWRFQAGSLTPYWQDSFTIHHYTYIDSSGAEYRLGTRKPDGTWISSESVYLTYDPVTTRLYFHDGSFWLMNSISAGNEQDAGTRYPILMQDANGNQVIIRYQPGIGINWENSSARIKEIEDVRATQDPSPPYNWRSYKFTYNTGAIPHLTQIDFYMGFSGQYQFTYLADQALQSPFAPPQAFGTTHLLRTMTDTNLNLTHTFSYGSNSSGELTQADLPYGGHVRWEYRDIAYSDNKTFREVQNRYLAAASGGAETTYAFSHGGVGETVGSTFVDDPAGGGLKSYVLMSCGLLSSYAERPAGSTSANTREHEYTWAADSDGNIYLGALLTIQDPGTAYEARSKVEQTVDTHGNLTQAKRYNFGNLTTPARTYNYTYVTGSNYTSRYIFNLLSAVTVTDGTNNATLATNTYDATALTSRTGLREHDTTNYGTGFIYRGNVTQRVANGLTTNIAYDITGAVASADDNNGHTVAVTPAAGTNNAAPGAITPNSNQNLAETMTWNSFLALTQDVAPNSATSSAAYDSYGRPASATSPYGASTTYLYNNTPPAYTTATTNGHWVKTTYDGLGRTIKVEAGAGSSTKSIVESEYAACACSPFGKVKRVSQPYAPGGTLYWTTNAWDCLGRTTSVTHPDGSVTNYLYQGNTVKVTDPAGKWKKYTMDVFGDLTKVTEPDPAGGADVDTLYSYNVRDQLTQVSMTRSAATQTRTFNYDLATGRLSSAVNPENGTAAYTYNAEGLPATKTDAKNQQVQYSYDSYHRVTQIRRTPAGWGSDDGCYRVTFSYDTNPYDGSFTQNGQGRVTAADWSEASCNDGQWREMYSYTAAGLMTKKRLTRVTWNYSLEGAWTYDNEGRQVSVAYPNGGKTYSYTFDSMGRPTKLTDNSATPVDWAKDLIYGPAGETTQMKYTTDGTNASYYTETRAYNNLLQLTRLTVPGVIDHEYRYTAGQNNGRITQRKEWISGEEVTYQYDALNRLISAVTTGPEWGQSFGYDGFGNLLQQTVTKGSAPALSVNVNSATNRITTGGYTYDTNGNLTAMPLISAMSYDVENRLIRAVHTVNGQDQYRHDPAGRRLWKWDPQAFQETYFYSPEGEKLGTYSNGSSGPFTTKNINVYFAGKLIWAEGAVAVNDRLGSVVSQNRKYFPYGEEPTTTTQNRTKFATYFRDNTTALDYAVNRYYARTIGRFTSPDPGPVDAANPQSWNAYNYSLNDPVNLNDPSGLSPLFWSGFETCLMRVPWNMFPGGAGQWAQFCEGLSGGGPIFSPGPWSRPAGGGGGNANPPAHTKGGWTTKPASAAKTGWQYLTSIWSNCLSLFSSDTKRFRAGGLQTLLTNSPSGGGITWLDTRDSTVANRTVDSYAHNGNPSTLKTFVGSANAAVIPGTRNVGLGINWFMDLTQTGQIASTIHEALHVLLKYDDGRLKGWLGKFGFAAISKYNTGDITNWIEAGCPNEKEK